ncbi:hypothetical protein NOVO_09285 (plasmid) [Rickettsiales bacterium Ac37b]|nr:hypothetical protein NOVO_09285 [Rickettsiales bacterium Ac37b]
MYTSQSKCHSDCAKESKISEEEFRLWVDMQASKIRGLVKLLNLTLGRYDQIEQEIEDSVLELTGNYDIFKRKFTELTKGYYEDSLGKECRYISLLLTKLNLALKGLENKFTVIIAGQLSATEARVSR